MRFSSVSSQRLWTVRSYERSEAFTKNLPAVLLSKSSIPAAEAVPIRAASASNGFQEVHSDFISVRLGITRVLRLP